MGGTTITNASLELQANRFQMLRRLAGDLAHEVKNPLNAVVINLELLKRRIADGDRDDALERADRVGAEVRRVHELADALFKVMRPEREPRPPVGLDSVVDELLPLVELQAKLARVTLAYRPAGDGLRVDIHPSALKQAVLNVVAEVLDALEPDGGRLELHGEDTAEGPVLRFVHTAPPRHGESDRLAVVRAIVEAAGGRLDAPSPDDGTVRLLLPRAGR